MKNQKEKLSLKQKNQTGIRSCTYSKMNWIIPFAFTLLFFDLMLITGLFPYSTQEASASDYPKQSLQLTFTGDTVLSRYIEELAEKNGYNSLFENVQGVWGNSDYTFTNVEYALLVDEESAYEEVDKKVSLSGTTDTIEALLDAGINVFGYANNHTSDFGDAAFLDALSWMYGNGLNFSGYSLKEENISAYLEDGNLFSLYRSFKYKPYTVLTCENSTRIGYLAVVDPGTSETTLSDYVLNTSNENLYFYVNDAARNTDMTVVYVHSGTEYTFTPEDTQKSIAYDLIDAGADIVIETHSHTLQPIELYGDGIIFYGLGNFIMDQNQTNTRDGVIVQYNQSEDNSYFELIPLRINDGYVQIAAGQYYKKRINRILTKWLESEFYVDDESGHIIIPWGNS